VPYWGRQLNYACWYLVTTAIPLWKEVKMDPIYMDRIYVDKCGDETASYNWVYYRLTSVDRLGNPAGKEGSNIEICRLRWPWLGDSGTPVETPGHTSMGDVLGKWGVDHEKRGILIGLRERAVNVGEPTQIFGNPTYGELRTLQASMALSAEPKAHASIDRIPLGRASDLRSTARGDSK
jgi:hypothetical protein